MKHTNPIRANFITTFQCWRWLAIVLSVFGISRPVTGAVILDLAELTLLPNTANQSFTISVQNTGSAVDLTGVQLELVIGTGGTGAPAFQSVTLLAVGSLFANNNTGDRGAESFGGLTQVYQRLTSTSSGSVTLGTGTFDLARVTFDTTGIAPGVYSWSAANSPNGVSYFTDTSPGVTLNPALFDGTLTVVPEPLHLALPAFGCLVILAGALRKWHHRARD